MAKHIVLGKRLVNPIQTVNLIGLHPTSRGSADPLETAADELPVKSGYPRLFDCKTANNHCRDKPTYEPDEPYYSTYSLYGRG